MRYRVWLRDNEDEGEGRVYLTGPGIAAEDYARSAYERGDTFVSIRVNVRRIDDNREHDEVLVFDVNVLMEPHFESSLRSTITSVAPANHDTQHPASTGGEGGE